MLPSDPSFDLLISSHHLTRWPAIDTPLQCPNQGHPRHEDPSLQQRRRLPYPAHPLLPLKRLPYLATHDASHDGTDPRKARSRRRIEHHAHLSHRRSHGRCDAEFRESSTGIPCSPSAVVPWSSRDWQTFTSKTDSSLPHTFSYASTFPFLTLQTSLPRRATGRQGGSVLKGRCDFPRGLYCKGCVCTRRSCQTFLQRSVAKRPS